MHITETITFNRPPEQVYAFWWDYGNLPRFMLDIESVRIIKPGWLHFKTKPHDGESAEWDVEIVEEVPQSRIAWRLVQGAEFQSSGSVSFHQATGRRGTVVRIEMEYSLPTIEAIKAKFAKLFGEAPDQRVKKTLLAAKQILETGGIVISEATVSHGHPGQPPADSEMPQFSKEFNRTYPASIEQG